MKRIVISLRARNGYGVVVFLGNGVVFFLSLFSHVN